MMTLTLSAEQRMYQIMKTSYEMKRNLSGRPECKLEYQIANRIHLNAFCYLVNKGLMPAECEENGRIALSLTIEGTTHVCAAKSVKGVLKADFEPVEKAIQGLKERMDQEDRLEREAQRSKKTAQHAAAGTAQAALIRPQMVRTEGPAVDIGAVFRETQNINKKATAQAASAATAQKARISNDTITAPASENPEQAKAQEKEPAKQDPEPDVQTEEPDKKEEIENSMAGPVTEPEQREQPESRKEAIRPEETDAIAEAKGTESSESEDSISAAAKEPQEETPEDSGTETETTGSDKPDKGLSAENEQAEPKQAVFAKEEDPVQKKEPDEEESGQPTAESAAKLQPEPVAPAEPLNEPQEPEAELTPEPETDPTPAAGPEPEAASKQDSETASEPEQEPEERPIQGPETVLMTEPTETAEPVPDTNAHEEPEAEEADDARMPEDQVQEEEITSAPEEKKHHFTAREPEPVTEEPAPESVPEENPDTEVPQPAHSKKRGGIGGIFGRFMPKNSAQEPSTEQAVPEAAKQPATLYDTQEESDFSDDTPGITLCHTHLIKLKKTFGNAASDPYVFYIWPTEVIEMYPDRMPTSIFVYAKSPYGTIVQRVSDLKIKYVSITMDGKQFTVFGSWQNGRFETEVALINKTASVYNKIEVIRQNDPDIAEDAMLDPFRSAKENRKPEYFIVPLYGTNRGQDNVPIAAFARVNDKNYVIEAAGKEKNSLLVSAANITSEITGRWEDGTFHYEIRQLDQI